MPYRLHIAVLSCILLSSLNLGAQGGNKAAKSEGTFGLSILGGANFSQIDGDNFKGYHKIGLYAGLRGVVRISDPFQLRVELLYSQKGSEFESTASAARGERERMIGLDYAEIPIIAAYKITPAYSRTEVWLEGGISIARLLNSSVTDAANPSDKEFIYENIEDDFGKTDFSLIVGVSVNPIPAFGFGLRASWGLVKFYEYEGTPPVTGDREFVELLRNYSLSLFALYHF